MIYFVHNYELPQRIERKYINIQNIHFSLKARFTKILKSFTKMIPLDGEHVATIGCKMLKETEIQDVLYSNANLGFLNVCAYATNHNVQLNRAT